MSITRRRLVTSALAVIAWSRGASSGEAVQTMKSDLETLARMIELPRRPATVAWEARKLGGKGLLGPDDWELLAVLTFSAADMAAIAAMLSPKGGTYEADFPDWVVSALGDRVERGSQRARVIGEVYDAAPFARAPLLQGWAMPLADGCSVFVALSTT